MNDSINIPVHYPQDFKINHLCSQAEELLNQYRDLEAHIANLLVIARELQSPKK